MAGRSNKGGERLLTLRRNVWWFRQQVPAAVRAVIGGSQFLMVNLRTADVVEAKRRRDELESQTRIQFRQIKLGRKVTLELPGWMPREAAAQRDIHGPAERGALWREALANEDDPQHDDIRDLAADEAERFRDDTQRRAFNDALRGRVPADHHLEEYLSTAGLAPKTTGERRGLVQKMARWATGKGLTLDRIDRKQAGKYVTEEVDKMHPVTQPFTIQLQGNPTT